MARIDLASGKVEQTEFTPLQSVIFNFAADPNDKNILYGVFNTLSKYDVKAKQNLKTVGLEHSYYNLNISSDGKRIYIGGTASTYKDIGESAKYDLMIAGIAALSLILLIMMFVTRSLVAALVIVGTVALSLGASIGLSVLVWQYILGIPLYWVILPLAVILLLAVGSDYNLLLISRFKEEIGAGLNTGDAGARSGDRRRSRVALVLQA